MPPIPPHVLRLVTLHTGMIAEFNATVLRLRTLGQRFGDPGRYEWEFRATHQAEADNAVSRLEEIETLATGLGVPLDTLYAHVPTGKPGREPVAEAARTWRTG